VKVLTAIRAGLTEFRRTWILSDWSPGRVYTWPEQLHPSDVLAVARELGLEIANQGAICRAKPSTRWKLTLDQDAQGQHLAGVATCINDDEERAVVVLELQ